MSADDTGLIVLHTDKHVGEVVLIGAVTEFHCGLKSSKKTPTQRQVAALSKQLGVPLVFDPEVHLDSDAPECSSSSRSMTPGIRPYARCHAKLTGHNAHISGI